MFFWIFLGVVLGLVLALILTVLLTPLVLYCDTDRRKCYIKLSGIFRASLIDVEGSPHFMFKTIGFSKKINLITALTEKKASEKSIKESPKGKTKKSSFKKSFGSILRFIRESLKTFRVKRFILDIDLDDYVLNGQLYPLFYWLSADQISFSTNYHDHNYLHLRVENRLIRIIPPMWRLMISK